MLSAEALHAPKLGVGIATVASGTLSLLVCHWLARRSFNARDPHARVVLSMTALGTHVLSTLEAKNDFFLAPEVPEHFAGHLGPGNGGLADGDLTLVPHEQNLFEGDGVTGLPAGAVVADNDVPQVDGGLSSAVGDDGKHD